MRIKRLVNELGMMLAFPLLFIVVIFPALMITVSYASEDIPTCREIIVKISQIIIPLVSLMWPMALAQEYLSGQGNELLYINNRMKISRYIIPVIIYLVLTYVDFYIMKILFDFSSIILEYIRIAVICFFLSGLYYLASYVSVNFMIANIITITFVFLCIFSSSNGMWNYYVTDIATKSMLKNRYSIHIIAGIVMYIVGAINNKFMTRYN